MASTLKEMLPTYSESPLLLAFSRGRRSKRVKVSLSELRLRRLEKYPSGKNQPTAQAVIEAAAAPASPQRNTRMNNASRAMFVTAHTIDITVPS